MKNIIVHITTLGCSKNQYDSDILAGLLKKQGVTITEEPEQSDVIIINTCGFIGPAKEESVEAILEAVELKKQGLVKKVIVFGCLIVRYKKDMQKEISEVDAYYNTEDYKNILQDLNFKIEEEPDYFAYRNLKLPAHSAYIKIAEGCNHKCAFCAIPLMRGKHKSRSIENIVEEAKSLAANGIKELIIISQDSTYYGMDLYKEQKLTQLVKELEKIDSLQWIRLHYFYPTTVPDDLIKLMAASKKITPYIDIPLQHISNRMLKVMKRGGNKEKILKLLEKFRKEIPGLTIRTTFIVGHPEETEEDYLELKELVENFRFERVGIFKYSEEEGTSAYELKSRIPEKIMNERFDELMEIQREISFEKNQEKIGTVCDVIIDEKVPDSDLWLGRTYADSPEIDNEVYVSLKTPAQKIEIGTIISVKITSAEDYELYAIKEV